ncbi:NAC domain-containing protein 90-like [Rutidosis leptorrhynchoides]|uniref:NAC domain-containing protein 90-like n=1 Tax=Rutidosis leptorrhynchoides TaxID=125765 RepID=UPI003A99DD5C
MTPGFRFYPTEEELISFYLKHKIQHKNTSRLLQAIDQVIPELHVYDIYPSDLPQYAGERVQGDPEQWFFFIPRQEKEARGGRPSRLTKTGYWKATGSPSIVYSSSSNRAIGIKRILVFYNGRVPNGKKTKWKMNEYKAFKDEPSLHANSKPKLIQELSLCRVYMKSSCLISFDRRPSAGSVTIHEPRSFQQTVHNDGHHHATTHFDNQSLMAIRTSSRDQGIQSHSSSEDNVTITSCLMMEINDADLWNWEENLNQL